MKAIHVLMIIGLLVGSNAMAFGGASQDDNEDNQPPINDDVVTARWEPRQSAGKGWSTHVYNEIERLGSALLSTSVNDIESFCPNYDNLSAHNRKNFWVYLLSAISELESSHRPATSYQENFKDRYGNYVISRGLLQLSIESGNGYGCGFRTASDLHDAKQNLSCGIRILSRWVGRDRVISGKSGSAWRGGARYWSVLRTSSKLSKIKSWTRSIAICR